MIYYRKTLSSSGPKLTAVQYDGRTIRRMILHVLISGTLDLRPINLLNRLTMISRANDALKLNALA
jgi:hypothetical protein